MAGKFQIDYQEMREYATNLEVKTLDALRDAKDHGPTAAKALGVELKILHLRLRSLRMRALRGVLPQGSMLPGMYVKQVTTDGQGKPTAIQHRAEEVAPADPVPPDFSVKRISQLTDSEGRETARWTIANRTQADQYKAMTDALDAHMARYEGIAEPMQYPVDCDDDLQVWYPLGDPHIGLLSWHEETGADENLKSAIRNLYSAVDTLVNRAPASKSATLCQLGDFFHAEDNSQLTPGGKNKLDVDTRQGKIADLGFDVMHRMIDRMLEKHEQVSVINAPGNHDPMMSRMLKRWLEAVYRNEPRVNIESNNNPYIYSRFGVNLIGVHHGDGAKIADLPSIMAHDQPEAWGNTYHRAWYTGHIHHDSKKDFRGCSVESFRTMVAADYWNHWKGYRSSRTLSAIVLHRLWGDQGRSTVGIREVQENAKK